MLDDFLILPEENYRLEKSDARLVFTRLIQANLFFTKYT